MWYEITGQKSSATVNTNDVAEMQLDVYDYYGKPISNLTDKIGQPLKMSEKLDAETGQVTEYDFGLFIAEVNQSNMVQRITIYFYALNDPSVIRLYHINGTHTTLSDFGPVGYGKCGSFEGFCSGGGIRQLAQFAVKERLQMGEKVAWAPEGDPRIDARLVAQAAAEGDVLALEIHRTSARYLGRGAVDRHRPDQPPR